MKKVLLLATVVVMVLLATSVRAVTTDELISYWGFNTSADDDHGSNDGVVTGATLKAGILNSSYYFDGGSNEIIVSDHPTLAVDRNYSFNLWVQRQGDSSSGDRLTMMEHYNAGSKSFIYRLNEASGVIEYITSDDCTNFDGSVASATGLSNNKWYMVTLVHYSNATVFIYLNGTLDKATVTTDAFLCDSSEDFRFGYSVDNNNGFNGLIDEVAIFNRTLTQSDIDDLYNTGLALAYPFEVPPDSTDPTLTHPVCTSCDSGTNTTLDTTPTINVTCTDDSGCLMVRLSNKSQSYVDMGDNRNCTHGNGDTWICTLPSSDALGKGRTSSVYFAASDNASNYHVTPELSINIEVQDPQPPTYTNLQNNASTLSGVNSVINFSLTLSDDILLANVTSSNNITGEWLSFVTEISAETLDYSYTNRTNQSKGSYICGNFSFQDSSGNRNSTNLTCFTLINSAPSLTVVSPINNTFTSSTTVNFNFTTSDSDKDTITISTYVNEVLNNTGNFTLHSLADGVYNIDFNITDGDVFVETNNYIRTIDTSIPKFIIGSLNEFNLTNNTRILNKNNTRLNLDINITDTNLNYSSINITNSNDQAIFFNSSTASTTSYKFTDSITINNLSYDNYTVIIFSNDKSGNSNRTVARFETYNTRPPIPDVIRPTDQEVISDTGLLNVTLNVSSVKDTEGNEYKAHLYLTDVSGNYVADITTNLTPLKGLNTVTYNFSSVGRGHYRINITTTDISDTTVTNSSLSVQSFFLRKVLVSNVFVSSKVTGNGGTELPNSVTVFNVKSVPITVTTTNLVSNYSGFSEDIDNPITGNNLNFTSIKYINAIFNHDITSYYGWRINEGFGPLTTNLTLEFNVTEWNGSFHINSSFQCVEQAGGTNELSSSIQIFNYSSGSWAVINSSFAPADSLVLNNPKYDLYNPQQFLNNSRIKLKWSCRAAGGNSFASWNNGFLFNITFYNSPTTEIKISKLGCDSTINLTNVNDLGCSNPTAVKCNHNLKSCPEFHINTTFVYLNPLFNVSYYPYIVNYSNFRVIETERKIVSITLANLTNSTDSEAQLNYNGTIYPYNSKTQFIGFTMFNFSLNIPKLFGVDQNLYNYSFFFNYNNSFIDKLETRTTQEFNNSVYKLIFDNCTGPGINTLNISWKNTTNESFLSVNFRYTHDFWLPGFEDLKKNFSSSGTGNQELLCLYPNWTNIESDLLFDYDFALENFEFSADSFELNNITQQLTLYVSSGTNRITFTVTDTNANKVEGAIIKILQFNVDTNTFKTVESVRTNNDGQATARLVKFTTWYKFIIEVDGVAFLETDSTKLFTDTKDFVIDVAGDTWFENFDVAKGVAYDPVSYNNLSGFVSWTFSDPSNSMHKGCLKVIEIVRGKEVLKGESCETSSAATLLVNIGAGNHPGKNFIATGFLIFDDNIPLSKKIIGIGDDRTFYDKQGGKTEGVFASFMISTVLFFVGIWNPIVGLTLYLIGISITAILQLWKISLTYLIGLIVLGLLVMFKMRRE